MSMVQGTEFVAQQQAHEDIRAAAITVVGSYPPGTARHSTKADEYYFHIRAYHTEEKLSGPTQVLSTRGGGTVFMRKEKDGEFYAGVALCHENDSFCKRIGRNVARRKYFNNRQRIPACMGFHIMFSAGQKYPSYEDAKAVYDKASITNVRHYIDDVLPTL